MTEPWYKPATKSGRVAVFFVFHTVAVTVWLALFAALDYLLKKELGDPLFFDAFPVRFVLEGADLVLLVAYLICAIRDAVTVF